MKFVTLAAAIAVAAMAAGAARASDPVPTSSPLKLAQAGSSCRNYFAQCSARCANNPKGESQAKCTADHCRPKLASCRRSGCWTEGKAYGGGTQCGLAKQ